MEPDFQTKNIRPVLELHPTLPNVLMDAEQIYQVLLNIVFNATHAMGETGGTLTIHTQPLTEGGASVAITDTGCGMSAEKQAQIFTPFYTDKNRGTGLGLAITKNIVGKHNGRITVQSKEGEGTTFTVSLGNELSH